MKENKIRVRPDILILFVNLNKFWFLFLKIVHENNFRKQRETVLFFEFCL